MRLPLVIVVGVAIVVAIGVAAGVALGVASTRRDAGWARHIERIVPGSQANVTVTVPPPGVHKCRQPDGELAYTDKPCERGTREQEMGGGTVTTVPALAAKPTARAGSAGLIQGFDQATIDKLREQQIDAAANR